MEQATDRNDAPQVPEWRARQSIYSTTKRPAHLVRAIVEGGFDALVQTEDHEKAVWQDAYRRGVEDAAYAAHRAAGSVVPAVLAAYGIDVEGEDDPNDQDEHRYGLRDVDREDEIEDDDGLACVACGSVSTASDGLIVGPSGVGVGVECGMCGFTQNDPDDDEDEA